MYTLITTKEGQIPIQEIKEGTEVLSLGKWKIAPKPEKRPCIRCSFDYLPTTSFQREYVWANREVSACHNIILGKTKEERPELSVRGFFKADKKSSFTVFQGLDDLTYWLPRFIKIYDVPLMPSITDIGFNINHGNKKFDDLDREDLTERNLEYVLEGMLRRCFNFCNLKYYLMRTTTWSEVQRIVLRLLDIECDVFVRNDVTVRNPVQLYKHIKDDYNKSRISDEEIVYNLRREYQNPDYTVGYKIIKKEEIVDWTLPDTNPDVNTLNPQNHYGDGVYLTERY